MYFNLLHLIMGKSIEEVHEMRVSVKVGLAILSIAICKLEILFDMSKHTLS